MDECKPLPYGTYRFEMRGANQTSGYYAGQNAWKFREAFGIVIMVRTFNALGDSSTDRVFPYYGSALGVYGDGGYKFDGFTTGEILATGQPVDPEAGIIQ